MAQGRHAEADVSGYQKNSFADVKDTAPCTLRRMGGGERHRARHRRGQVLAHRRGVSREAGRGAAKLCGAIGFALPKVHEEAAFADADGQSEDAKVAVGLQMAGILLGKDGSMTQRPRSPERNFALCCAASRRR